MHELYWFRLDLAVTVCIRLIDKSVEAEVLIYRFLAESAEVTFVSCKEWIILLVLLCVLCASARVNIYNLF